MRSEQGSRAPFISKLDELNLATTRTTEQPARTPNKRGAVTTMALTRCRRPTRANLYALASLTRIYSLRVARCRRRGELATQKLIGHSLRPAAQLRPKIGCHPADSDQTTSNMDPDKARQGAPRPTAYGPGARASMITSQIYRVPSQDTHTEPPASTNYDTTSRPLTDSDQETQADQSTEAATQPAVWWHHLHEPRPS